MDNIRRTYSDVCPAFPQRGLAVWIAGGLCQTALVTVMEMNTLLIIKFHGCQERRALASLKYNIITI